VRCNSSQRSWKIVTKASSAHVDVSRSGVVNDEPALRHRENRRRARSGRPQLNASVRTRRCRAGSALQRRRCRLQSARGAGRSECDLETSDQDTVGGFALWLRLSANLVRCVRRRP
jgi:hypothetical protein